MNAWNFMDYASKGNLLDGIRRESAGMFALAAAQALRLMQMWSEAAMTFDRFAMALSGIALAASAAINGFSAADGFPEVGTSGYDHRAV